VVTPSVDGALLLGAVMTANPADISPGDGYALREAVPGIPSAKLAVEDRVQATAGPIPATAFLSANDYWGIVLAAFKPAN
jgi:hypothetical protein